MQHQLFVRFTTMVCVFLVLSTGAKHLGKDDHPNDEELITGDDEEARPSLLFFQAWLKGAVFPPKKHCDDESSEEGPLADQPEAHGVHPHGNASNVSASEILEMRNATGHGHIEDRSSVICVKSNDTDCPEETGDEIVEIA